MSNCEKCMARYAPYRPGPKEEPGSYLCMIPVGVWKRKWYSFWRKTFIPDVPKGVCQFHNPKSIFSIKSA